VARFLAAVLAEAGERFGLAVRFAPDRARALARRSAGGLAAARRDTV
jgi:hypothetical protein